MISALSFFSLLRLILQVQLFPGDWPFEMVRKSPWLRLLMGVVVSLYRFRKLLFIVSRPTVATVRGYLPYVTGHF